MLSWSAFFETTERPVCYDRDGRVCNQSAVSALHRDVTEQTKRLRRLQEAQADPTFAAHLAEVNGEALAAENRLRERAGAYERSWDAFDKAFAAYEEEARNWGQVARGLEKEYHARCRSLHDVTMPCEKQWRVFLDEERARGPLPRCKVGVVTPYVRVPRHAGWLDWMLSQHPTSH
uniref:Uncharacterized protein n=1 Tax=Noctiluca scintillans TaxID=2966 RepID=A0A7S1EVC9_NOCSC|mmetsp:Transcript_10731/g.29867  ORF Transcript_10731/g.29867 Transcript_10731/m.29867 type:complete len:176 (+) Transcript_10731:109-636(+)